MIEADIEIRRLDPNEVDIFRTIRLAALEAEPSSFASSSEDWQAFSEELWAQILTESPVIVAFRHGKPVGMMGLMKQKPGKTSHRAFLIMVYVDEENRGTGIATRLLKAVEKLAVDSGIIQLELDVSVENVPAIRFYRREGYAQIGRIPAGFLEEGKEVDLLLMARRMESP